MLFNFGKYKDLHAGQVNLNVNYNMGDTVLGATVKESDLGITISADMKVSFQRQLAWADTIYQRRRLQQLRKCLTGRLPVQKLAVW